MKRGLSAPASLCKNSPEWGIRSVRHSTRSHTGIFFSSPDIIESRIEALRASGTPWRAIAKELGVGIGTARRASQSRAKNLCGSFGTGIGESDYAL